MLVTERHTLCAKSLCLEHSFGGTSPQRSVASSFMRFLDHTQQRTTFCKTPLYKWPARRRDLYLTPHNTHNRHTPMPPAGFEPAIPGGERSQTNNLDRAATWIGTQIFRFSYTNKKSILTLHDTVNLLHRFHVTCWLLTAARWHILGRITQLYRLCLTIQQLWLTECCEARQRFGGSGVRITFKVEKVCLRNVHTGCGAHQNWYRLFFQ